MSLIFFFSLYPKMALHSFRGTGELKSLAKYISLMYLEIRRAGGKDHLVRLTALAVTRNGHVSKRLIKDINLVFFY